MFAAREDFMLPDPLVLLKILLFAALPLLAAGLFFRRGKVLWGCVLGLILLAAMEVYVFWSMNAAAQACLRETCLAAGRPPDCEPYPGCTEGNGILSLLYQCAGVADILLLAFAAFVVHLRRRTTSPRAGPDASA